MKFAVALALAASTAAWGHERRAADTIKPSKTVRHIYRVQGCSADAGKEVLAAFERESSTLTFDLYLICTEQAWRGFLKSHKFPATVVAVTDWEKGRIFIGPGPLRDAVLLKYTVKHELQHLRCKCSLGETS